MFIITDFQFQLCTKQLCQCVCVCVCVSLCASVSTAVIMCVCVCVCVCILKHAHASIPAVKHHIAGSWLVVEILICVMSWKGVIVYVVYAIYRLKGELFYGLHHLTVS